MFVLLQRETEENFCISAVLHQLVAECDVLAIIIHEKTQSSTELILREVRIYTRHT